VGQTLGLYSLAKGEKQRLFLVLTTTSMSDFTVWYFADMNMLIKPSKLACGQVPGGMADH
jgi:hypothetical protein